MTSRLEQIQIADNWRATVSHTLNDFLDHAVVRIAESEESDPTLRVLYTALDLVDSTKPLPDRAPPIEVDWLAYTLAEAMYRLLQKDGRV